MNKTEMLVTVIVPTYNRAHLIQETIQSVLDQTCSTWELVIVDDGSNDNTESVVRKFADERISYYPLDHSGVISKVRNAGLRHASGNYIAFLDSDDLWEPHKLEFQLSLLEKYPKAAFTFSHGVQFGKGAIPPPPLEMIFVGDVFQAQLIEERFVLYPSTFFFKKEVLQTVGYLDESLSVDDIDFFLRIARKYDGIFSGEKLARLRKHDGNISMERELILCTGNLEMYKKFFIEGLLTRRQFVFAASKQHYKFGILHLSRNNPAEATQCFLEYIQLKPLHYKGWIRLFYSLIRRFSN